MSKEPILYSLFGRLPRPLQHAIKSLRYARQISTTKFQSTEPEFFLLADLVKESEWVVDIGANVGHYTMALSTLVGASGRVIAFEPIATTFSLLSANAQQFKYPNVTLINAAASDRVALVSMTIPRNEAGQENHYRAHIDSPPTRGTEVLALPLDSLEFPHRVSLVKIDAEGHEGFVLIGMRKLLQRDRPALILEGGARGGLKILKELGYRFEKRTQSPNIIAYPSAI